MSSDSCTSDDAKSGNRLPFVSSCSTLARPRVTSFSSLDARYDGHMNPPEAWLSARHFPMPTQRCTAVVKSPPSWAKLNPPPAGIGAAIGRRRSASRGCGDTRTPGLSRSFGSNSAFTAPNNSMAAGEYMIGSSSLRARPSPCSPEHEPPCFTTRCAASNMNCRNTSADSSSAEFSKAKSIRT